VPDLWLGHQRRSLYGLKPSVPFNHAAAGPNLKLSWSEIRSLSRSLSHMPKLQAGLVQSIRSAGMQ
jgi:hypothetical protein